MVRAVVAVRSASAAKTLTNEVPFCRSKKAVSSLLWHDEACHALREHLRDACAVAVVVELVVVAVVDSESGCGCDYGCDCDCGGNSGHL